MLMIKLELIPDLLDLNELMEVKGGGYEGGSGGDIQCQGTAISCAPNVSAVTYCTGQGSGTICTAQGSGQSHGGGGGSEGGGGGK